MLKTKQWLAAGLLSLSVLSVSAWGQALVLDGRSQETLEQSASALMAEASPQLRAEFATAFQVMMMQQAMAVLEEAHGLTGNDAMDISRLSAEERQLAKARLMRALDGKSMAEVASEVRSSDYERARMMVMFVNRKSEAMTPLEGSYTRSPSEAGAFTQP